VSKQSESTDKDVMEGNDRLGARSAKRSSLRRFDKCLIAEAAQTGPLCATFFDRSFPSTALHLKDERTKMLEPL